MSEPYGVELVMDLRDCDRATFTRESLDEFFSELCIEISMDKSEVHFWDDVGVPANEQQTDPKTKGTSAVCFILTSTIVVHTLELLDVVYVNIFSCKRFDRTAAEEMTRRWFKGKVISSTLIERT